MRARTYKRTHARSIARSHSRARMVVGAGAVAPSLSSPSAPILPFLSIGVIPSIKSDGEAGGGAAEARL